MKYFNPVGVGQTLKEIAIEVIQAPGAQSPSEILNKWYQSALHSDFFTWQDSNGKFIKQQLCVNGLVVEWNFIEGLKTGTLVVEYDKGKVVSESISYDDSPHENLVQMAIDVLNHTTLIEEERFELIENLTHPKKLKDIEQNEYIRLFGITLNNYNKESFNFWGAVSQTARNLMTKKQK